MAFTPQRLDEDKEKDKRIILSVSANQQEQEELSDFKKLIGITDDSKAYKTALCVALNHLGSTLGKRFKIQIQKKSKGEM